MSMATAASGDGGDVSAVHGHVEAHMQKLLSVSPLYGLLFPGIKLVSTSQDHVCLRLPLERHHTNSHGGLHGATSCALVDLAGGVAIASHDLRNSTGVSTDIHVSFLGSAREGDVILVDGRVRKCGGTLAFTDVEIRREDTGQVITTGTHTKFVKQR